MIYDVYLKEDVSYNLDLLDEVYFGKTDECIKLEKMLDDIRTPFLGKYMSTKKVKINSSKEVQAFNRAMEKFLNLHCFMLFINNNLMVNAFTCPVDQRFDYDNAANNVVADKKGFKFRKCCDFSIICNVTAGLMFNPDFTTEEVFAIILHEIGHNFNSSVNTINAPLTANKVATRYLYDILTIFFAGGVGLVDLYTNRNSYVNKKVDKETEKRMENAVSVAMNDWLRYAGSLLEKTAYTVYNFTRLFTLGLSTLYSGVMAFVSNVSMYICNPLLVFCDDGKKEAKNNELFADNFASMYGYGAALSSAFVKMENAPSAGGDTLRRTIDSIPVVGKLINCVELPGLILATAFDEHPQGINRCMDQIEMLKNELNKTDLDPKMRKQIQKDIKELEVVIREFTEKKSGVKDPYSLRKSWNLHLKNKYHRKNNKYNNQKRYQGYDDAYKKALD